MSFSAASPSRQMTKRSPSSLTRESGVDESLLYRRNKPPTIIFPSGCNATTSTKPPSEPMGPPEPAPEPPALKVVSSVPSAFSRMIPSGPEESPL